ncbi:M24 family metallopeptidase [Natronosalvus caseinilyticus]|uniref:M24 family metallopeptidase n=1 Tax=Natronosalvus caseinilyticus TaxID=2953747 RepID=UPI0028A65B2F|nr:M24 family metallopeptidase [Natronosalvus caseinilyticus]
MARYRLGQQNDRQAYYERFDDAEFDRRYAAVRELLEERDLKALVVYGDGGFHADTIGYLLDYRPPFATYLLVFADPDEPTTVLVGISNHVQYVRESSVAEDVDTMLPDPAGTVIDRLREAGVDGDRIGLSTGDPRYGLSVPHDHAMQFEANLDGELVDVTADVTRLISVTGPAEREVLGRSATLLDEAMTAFETALEPGVTERELAGVLADACAKAGGALGATFISSAPQESAGPGEPLPWKQPSARTVEEGDVVTTEISAGFRGYKTQIHRPYVVDSEPSREYADAFAVARETYDGILDALQPGNTARDVADAMAPLEHSPYKNYDVLVHGYGSGYRHPFIGVEESNYWPGIDDSLTETWTFEPGQVIVVQPNVATPDERVGLQFGTTVVIREDGPENLQTYPAEFVRV